MAEHQLGIIMHGITGRMGLNQHLKRSILAIRDNGGVKLTNGDTVIPSPLLLGRDINKVKAIAKENGITDFTDDYNAAINSTEHQLFFDAGSTLRRPELLIQAIKAGKHVYCEKPIGLSSPEAISVAGLAKENGVKNGVVMDKLFLPGLLKLKKLINDDFFGRILAVKIDFGYWVFTGEETPPNRPSWNYRKPDGGGIIFDMMAHWRYVLDHLFAPVISISCIGANHIQERWNEDGNKYSADADDAAYALLQLEDGIVAQINNSWCTRVNRDDLVTIQVDGTKGSAVAGLNNCKVQALANTPRPVWNPDEPQAESFRNQWEFIDEHQDYPNGFRSQWEQFIRYIYDDGEWIYTLEEGIKGVQLAEAAMKSWEEKRVIGIS